MSRATEITTSRRGDVTNARDKQTVVVCPLLMPFQIIEPAVAVSLGSIHFLEGGLGRRNSGEGH